MNWYLSKIVYRIIIGEHDQHASFEEQLRLVSAYNKKDALQKANTIALNEQFSFFDEKQRLVQWKFITVSELLQVGEWTDGAEIYSVINEVSDADAYIALANDKTAALKVSNARNQPNLI